MTTSSAGDEERLVERATYMVGNPSAWDEYDEGASDVIRDLLAAHARLRQERDDARALAERLKHEVESAGSLRLRMEAHRQAAAASNAEAERLREALERAELAARDLMPYLVWQLSPESPGYHPTFRSAVAAFRGAFAPEVFAPGSSRFDKWHEARALQGSAKQ